MGAEARMVLLIIVPCPVCGARVSKTVVMTVSDYQPQPQACGTCGTPLIFEGRVSASVRRAAMAEGGAGDGR